MQSPLRKSRSLPQKQYSSLILQSKIKQYRAKLQDSQKKFNEFNLKSILTGRKSSHSKLRQVYNSPRRQQKNRPQTATQDTSAKKQILNYMIDSNELNPEKRFTLIDIKASILLSQLDGKAKQITSYSDQNAELLKRKKNLEERIAKLKEAIAEETKKLSQAKTSCGILNNDIDETMRRYNQKNIQSNEQNKIIQETTNDLNRLKKKKMQNQAESDYNQKWIAKLMKQNDQLSLYCQNTNVMLLKEDQIRIDTKNQLIHDQKVMQNASITYKQLVSQKQHLQVHVNKAYYANKIAENAKGSRLPVNSARK